MYNIFYLNIKIFKIKYHYNKILIKNLKHKYSISYFK